MDLQRTVEGSYFLAALGIATSAYVCFEVVCGLLSFVKTYFTPSKLCYKSFGEWALVTGAGDGIGKSIALELAKHGMNIILVSLYAEELTRVADEIRKKYHVETRCIAFDFTDADNLHVEGSASSVYDVIRNVVDHLEIGILVNNVGIGAMGEFLETIDDSSEYGKPSIDMINCNTNAMVKMTQLALGQMIGRKKGLVINISSGLASSIGAMLALYAATKKFVDTFSKCTNYEYKDGGIVIQSIQPGVVATEMTKGFGDAAIPHHVFVQHLFKTIGKADMTCGYWIHAIQVWLLTKLPDVIIFRDMKKLRQKYRSQ